MRRKATPTVKTRERASNGPETETQSKTPRSRHEPTARLFENARNGRRVQEICTWSEITRTQFDRIQYGEIAPTSAELDRLADAMFRTVADKRKFLSDFRAVTSFTDEEPRTLEEIARGWRPMRVGQLHFEPISGPDSLVEELVVNRFCGQLPGGAAESDFQWAATDLQSQLFENRIDILSHLTTIDRHFSLKFCTHFPFRFSLGAIVHDRHRHRLPELRQILRIRRGDKATPHSCPCSPSGECAVVAPLPSAPESIIRPITVEKEIGWLHCVNRLEISERSLKSDLVGELKPQQVADQFLKADEEEATGSGRIPVVLLDELSHFKVLSALNCHNLVAIPVVPLSTDYSARNCDCRREAPVFHVGLAVNPRSRLGESFSDGLKTYVSGEVETVSDLLVKTAANLESTLTQAVERVPIDLLTDHKSAQRFVATDQSAEDAARKSVARRWVRFAMRLSSADLASDAIASCWKPVLARAREKMLVRQVDHAWNEIPAFVDALGQRFQWFKLHRIIEEVEREFDVRMPRPPDFSTESSTLALAYRLESESRQYPARLELVPGCNLALTDRGLVENREAVREVLKELWQQEADVLDAGRAGQLEEVINRIFDPASTDCSVLLLRVQARAKTAAKMSTGSSSRESSERTAIDGPDAASRFQAEAAGVLIARSAGSFVELEALFVRHIWRGYGLTRTLVESWMASTNMPLLVRTKGFHRRQLILLQQLGFRAQTTSVTSSELWWIPDSKGSDKVAG